MIAIVGPPFGALAMASLRGGDDRLARHAAARDAVLLPAVAISADRDLLPATRTIEQSLVVVRVGHVLAPADFFAPDCMLSEAAPVDASSHDTEGQERSLLAFILSARPPS
jgi:hypothetical protein